MTRIAVVDYGMGNRRSVEKALEHIGAVAELTNDPERLRTAAGLVIPGVGAFPRGMRNMHELGLVELIRERAAAGTPVLGICLGMQLLFERSVELEPTDGLGLIEGEVTPLVNPNPPTLTVPHMGWNEVVFERDCALTAGLPPRGCAFYHVHSFVVRPRHDEEIAGTTEYGERFATIVARDRVFGVQFHPEKSSADGLGLLRNFVAVTASISTPAHA